MTARGSETPAGSADPVQTQGRGRVREWDVTDDEEPLGDAALVRLSLEDAEAFGVLYERYCDRIFRFILRRLSDRTAAEDVTTEVFIKAMRGLEGYRPQGAPFSAWLFRIAANATTDYVRARKFTAPLEVAPEVVDRAESLEDRVVRRVDADRAWAAVDRLTDAQRTAVTLRLAHDQTVPEIARRMNRSEGAVKLLLNRGLTAARQHLQESGDDPRPAAHVPAEPATELRGPVPDRPGPPAAPGPPGRAPHPTTTGEEASR